VHQLGDLFEDLLGGPPVLAFSETGLQVLRRPSPEAEGEEDQYGGVGGSAQHPAPLYGPPAPMSRKPLPLMKTKTL